MAPCVSTCPGDAKSLLAIVQYVQWSRTNRRKDGKEEVGQCCRQTTPGDRGYAILKQRLVNDCATLGHSPSLSSPMGQCTKP